MNSVDIRGGTYLAGLDIPEGLLRLKVMSAGAWKSYCGVNSDLGELEAMHDFLEQTYVEIKSGEYLRIEPGEDDQIIRIEKIR